MTPVFVDTSFYLAILSPEDASHQKAEEWVASNNRHMVTTEFVLVELANAISRGPARSQFGTFVKALRNNANVRLIQATSSLFDSGLKIYSRRLDKDWSLTDSISFHVMAENGLTEALTADRHFEQAGFTVLLK